MDILLILFSFLAHHLFACEITQDVEATLKRCLPGSSVKKITPDLPDGSREYFEILFNQPVDHEFPEHGTFEQRLVLAHRGYEEPLVLQTSGYLIFRVAPARVTQVFDLNQIQVEHRFFAGSRPKIMDWSKLDIRQSAEDFHKVTLAFQKIYKQAWINTGASKGGMTSLYHRRFYPDDLVGTLADVAPHSHTTNDLRYPDFIDHAGGDLYKECRSDLAKLQSHLLKNRIEFEKQLSGTYSQLGGVDVAFEHAVQEITFGYWQYQDPKNPRVGCHNIPNEKSSVDAVMTFFKEVTSFETNYSDKDLADFLPYFYQAATELGSPALKRSHLEGLLLYPYAIEQYIPKEIPITYSQIAMDEVGEWVRKSGERLMLTYGEFDPWSAGMFPAKTTEDCHWNIAPLENHRASIFYLAEFEKREAIETVARWIDKKPILSNARSSSLDDLEFNIRAQSRRM